MTETLYDTIKMNGVPFPVVRDVGYQALFQFSRKVVSGDYSRDSDDLISAKIWTGFPGGIGVLNNRDGSDEGKCWYTSIWSRDPYKITLNRRVVVAPVSPDVKYPLGDLADTFYAASASDVYAWNEASKTFGSTIGSLSADPVFRGVAWNGKLYIPCGAAGYHATDGATVDAISTDAKAVCFAVMSDGQISRLFALCADGALKSTTDGTNWTTEAQINTSETPHKLVVWMDRTENDTLFCVTSAGVYSYDPVSGILIRTRLSNVPAHPDNGLGAESWRPGEDLYVSFGTQAAQYAAGMSQIAFMGPDRRDGLPDELRGRIVDLCAEFNGLLALLEGVAIAADDPESEFDPGHEDEPTEISGTTAVSALLAYNGFGWHPLWKSSDASGSPTFLCVSGTSGAYRIWWGWGDRLHTIALSRAFSNPDQEFRTLEGDFEASGQLDTGYYDGAMREFDKLASHVEINLEAGTASETVAIEYLCDGETSWTLLGTASARGKTILPFGNEVQDDGTIVSRGVLFRRIRFRLTLNRDPDDSRLTPVLDSFVLKHIRLPLAGASFTLTVPLYWGAEGWGDRTCEHIKEELDALALSSEFVRLEHGDDSYRVRVSYINGNDRTGGDDRGSRTLNLVEVSLPGYDGKAA
jgi:hypothetical protein